MIDESLFYDESKRIEYLLAFENGTWEARVFIVPRYAEPADYAERVLAVQAQYRRVAYWFVLDTNPD